MVSRTFKVAQQKRPGFPPSSGSPANQLKALSDCLAGLPDRLSRIFMLRELDGMSTEDITDLLNITDANCWVMLHRARIYLRRCLEITWFKG